MVKQYPSVLNTRRTCNAAYSTCASGTVSAETRVLIPACVVIRVLRAVMITVTPQVALRQNRPITSCLPMFFHLPRIPQQHGVQNISWRRTEIVNKSVIYPTKHVCQKLTHHLSNSKMSFVFFPPVYRLKIVMTERNE